jgi:hypothetical protein
MPTPALPPAELDTISQFAARANVAVRTVYRGIKSGQIVVVYVGGNTPRIDPVANMARIKNARSSSGPRRGRPKKDAVP